MLARLATTGFSFSCFGTLTSLGLLRKPGALDWTGLLCLTGTLDLHGIALAGMLPLRAQVSCNEDAKRDESARWYAFGFLLGVGTLRRSGFLDNKWRAPLK
jgi:hypothetical protein